MGIKRLFSIFFMEARFLFGPIQNSFHRRKIIRQNNQSWYPEHPSLENRNQPTDKSDDNEYNSKSDSGGFFDHWI